MKRHIPNERDADRGNGDSANAADATEADSPDGSGGGVTMAEVAQRAGVAESTVSRALAGSPLVAEKTRTRIMEIASQAGYSVNVAARNLRRGSTGTIELAILRGEGEKRSLTDPFLLDMIGAVGDEATANGYDLLVSTEPPWDGRRPGNSITAGRADGIIFLGQGTYRDELNAFARRHHRMVVWGGAFDDDIYAVVGSDNARGGRLAARHLINNGRQNLAFLGNVNEPEVSLRYEGFIAEHRAAGVPFDDGLLITTPWDIQLVPHAVQRLMQCGIPFNGVVCASDAIAAAAISVLRRGGRRVPDDTAVIGFDDVQLAAHINPPLTTISQNVSVGGEILVRTLLAAIRGEQVHNTRLEPRLVVRESCGAARREPRQLDRDPSLGFDRRT